MSKKRIEQRKVKAAMCKGCNQWKRPNRVKMVDPRIIGIDKDPVPLCGSCRSKLVWNPIEIPPSPDEEDDGEN